MYVIRSKDRIGYIGIDHASGGYPCETSFLGNAKFFNDNKLYDAKDYLEFVQDHLNSDEFEICEVVLKPIME